jgi:hypothetical protein
MPRSKKGRLSGGARKEINARRSMDIVNGALQRARATAPISTKADGILFARVSKIIDTNHAIVAIQTKRGAKELRAEIHPLLSKRGATPIGPGFLVAVFFGVEFDPDVDEIRPADHFGIETIIDKKQAYALQKEDIIPSWMVQEADKLEAIGEKEAGFEFDYSGQEADADADAEATTTGVENADDDLDIDDI